MMGNAASTTSSSSAATPRVRTARIIAKPSDRSLRLKVRWRRQAVAGHTRPDKRRARSMAERIQRVLVVTAHPDDSEFGAGGTVAKLVREGKQVTYCILTNGNKGSGDRTMTPERLAKIREEEQRNAARVLGVEVVDFLGFPDCWLED